MPTPRERAREQTMADIVRLGRAQLAEVGAAQLSVRSLARDLGVVSSAVYRYVRSRDDLLTLLVVDAYDELADRVEAAVARKRAADHPGRFVAAAHAVRDWALAEPSRYALLYGSPVPGYEAPAERTTGPGTRVIFAIAGVVVEAAYAGALDGVLTDRTPLDLTATLRRDLGQVAAALGEETLHDLPDPQHDVVVRTLAAWAALFGLVSFEVFGQYGPGTFTRPAQAFDAQLAVVLEIVGLRS